MVNLKSTNFKKSYLEQIKRVKQLSKKPTAKISGLISLTIFLMAFFGMFAILPTFRTIASLNREIKDAEIVNKKLTNKIGSLSKAEDLYLKASKKTSLINRVMPEQAEFERLAWQVEWLALNKGVEIINGNYNEFELVSNKVETILEPKELELELTINGNYPKIYDFIRAVTEIDRLISIKAVSINSKQLRQGQAITANIKMTAYYLPYAN